MGALADWQTWAGLAVLLAAGLVAYLLVLSGVTLWMLTHPPRRTYAWATAKGAPGDPSELPGAGRRYDAWTVDRAGASLPVWDIAGDDLGGPVAVIVHGWGESRVTMLGRADALASACSRVLVWDLPGHGEARGHCRFGGREVEDLRTLIAAVGRPVVLYGFSLGAEIAIRCAVEGPSRGLVRALILEAPYRRGVTPARNMLGLLGFPRTVNLPVALAALGLLNREGLGARWRDLAADMPEGLPTLILHGEADEVCPMPDAEALAGHGTLVRIPGAGHLDLWSSPDVPAAVRDFIAEATKAE